MTDQKEKSYLVETYAQYPMELDKAKGVYVWDTEGNKYIDFYGGHAVCAIGHSPKVLADAIYEQANKFMFYSNLARIPIRNQGAKALIEFADSDYSRVFFCNSGGEANENALKIATKATGRSKIVALKGGFHGRTLLAMTATHIPAWHQDYASRIIDVDHIEPNDFDAINEAVTEETAAVILEPIQSIGGVRGMCCKFLEGLRKRCDEVGAYLIFDEVQTGVGRTGVPYVSGHSGEKVIVQADMSTSAKSIAGGFSMGVVLVTEEVSQKINPGDLGATFGGSPIAIAAMIATLGEIKNKNLMQNAVKFEKYVKENFVHPKIEKVRGRGCLLGIELVDGSLTGAEVKNRLFKKGIIVGTTSNPQIVHLLPSLTIETEHADVLKKALFEELEE